ncbi:MAG: 1-acyl-sn-glycerol-3-phosphate acyltransferase, partial [Acidimicrobiales bacterium]|nr:1-acyl-sn-glycerol-3-phosphate acyltransferase [Acidimicrobiales bacterium]
MISIEAEPINTRPKIYRRTRKIIRKLAVSVSRKMWKLEITGKENVPTNGPFLIAPVHRSNVDFLLAALITDINANFMAKDSLWKIKPLGRFMEHMGAFPVSRGKPDRHSLKIGQQVLDEGGVLVL